MEEIKETAYDWTTRDSRGYFSTNQKREIRRMTGFAETRPDEVTILKEPATNGGYLIALVPKTWFRMKPPRKLALTEQQRESLSKRMKNINKESGR
jgi:hypothetical protein